MSNQSQQRRTGRLAAVQFLYSWELNRPDNLADALSLFFESQEHPRDHYSFGEELIHGTIDNISEIDGHIRGMAHNWDFDRIAKVDLTILRVGIFEILHRKDIPPVVSINEAINLSKLFSNADSKRFINGILDRFKDQIGRNARKAENE
jgi:N utilization substance protein B